MLSCLLFVPVLRVCLLLVSDYKQGGVGKVACIQHGRREASFLFLSLVYVIRLVTSATCFVEMHRGAHRSEQKHSQSR